jgi:hypothetical protein
MFIQRFIFYLLKDMSKVRIGHEDVFIGKTNHLNGDTIVRDPIHDKYPFFYNPKWVANISEKKTNSSKKNKSISNVL